ncbi:PTS sorbitol transporter subunit IIA [Virgibacillus pantothenticus]|uniref:PTS glucitol/sorbitol transporter subunit IIA n=1 Tax=Virgibacillus TaxID=84406 RepID=UPI0009FAC852|nr:MULTISPECIES: PTS glucitol/sorbitol transporter subunit IIA [Virgibacillus]MBS7428533.1 PTS glucitol/sorbitol transporter subunit IIA [Virgibacillus sp. 19R1-5]MBU8567170.1 PTS glucitol/sorbitol transporter subunit IIA [Virgibacillus pantothenticus]MBU8600798.1 PTS glucitol/sorbitol transporter subunit IIA [Virgibacillus pantothenticus]MBU8635322.1 PTS glucitol/sorbitol transporter subunit IIA [Virgibacillus pantothenticus]MBU8643022.1 PTS glucitol/sorbitol transporter subunit IIA [Virgibac
MILKYETTVDRVGAHAATFLEEKMLILFGKDAPAELEDYCLSIVINDLKESINVGDILQLNDREYRITAVGEAVEKNLATLGHITLNFDGSQIPELPGTLYLEDRPISEVDIGDEIKIYER